MYVPKNLSEIEHRVLALESFIASFMLPKKEKEEMMTALIARYINRKVLRALYHKYEACFQTKAGKDYEELKFLFHNHDIVAEPLETLDDLVTVLLTGKKKPPISSMSLLEKDLNVLPVGFWNLNIIKETLIEVLEKFLQSEIESVCKYHFHIEEKEMPPLKERVDMLTSALISRAVPVKAQQDIATELKEEAKAIIAETTA